MAEFDDSFSSLLSDYRAAGSQAERAQLRKQAWEAFGRECAVFVLDMSGFSYLTRVHGPLHFLAMIEQMQTLASPVIERAGGHVVKFEADNCFARFDRASDAVAAAVDIRGILEAYNRTCPDDLVMKAAFGISWGGILDFGGRDFFGDAVNVASKLGEDLAEPGEILICPEAARHAGLLRTETVEYQISALTLTAHRVMV